MGRRARIAGIRAWRGAACRFGVTVYGDIGDIGQYLGAAVTAFFELEQFGRVVDEFCCVFIRQKCRMFQKVFDEGNVCRDATNTEFAQRTVHTQDCLFRGGGPCGDLDQQAIIITCDHPARIGGSAVQSNAHPRGRAIGGDAAIVRDEIVLRIFCCDAGLQGMAVQRDLRLIGFAGCFGQGFALGNQDLRLDDVDACDFFGDGVFDLDARVDFDKVEFTTVHIHQKFDRAGAFIIHMRTNAATQIADMFALFLG